MKVPISHVKLVQLDFDTKIHEQFGINDATTVASHHSLTRKESPCLLGWLHCSSYLDRHVLAMADGLSPSGIFVVISWQIDSFKKPYFLMAVFLVCVCVCVSEASSWGLPTFSKFDPQINSKHLYIGL